MGRPEAPIDYTMPERGELAEQLRAMRHVAGLSYEELAARTQWSAAHLKRAASGRVLPGIEIVVSYAWECAKECVRDDVEHHVDLHLVGAALTLHARAVCAVDRARRRARGSSVVPKPELARDIADLSGALRDAWARGGRPSARQMEKQSEGQLPRSTANVIANGHTVPKDLRQFVAFLEACVVSDRSFPAWFRAWFKVRGVPANAKAYDWMGPRVAEIYRHTLVMVRADQFTEGVLMPMVTNGDKSMSQFPRPTGAEGKEKVLETVGSTVGTIRIHLGMDDNAVRPTRRGRRRARTGITHSE